MVRYEITGEDILNAFKIHQKLWDSGYYDDKGFICDDRLEDTIEAIAWVRNYEKEKDKKIRAREAQNNNKTIKYE